MYISVQEEEFVVVSNTYNVWKLASPTLLTPNSSFLT